MYVMMCGNRDMFCMYYDEIPRFVGRNKQQISSRGQKTSKKSDKNLLAKRRNSK